MSSDPLMPRLEASGWLRDVMGLGTGRGRAKEGFCWPLGLKEYYHHWRRGVFREEQCDLGRRA